MRAVEKTTPYLDAKLLASPFADSEASYRLCLRIASGGMATVYLAMYRGTDGLQRPVAVKLIHPHLAKHAEFVEMFFDEAQLAACLDHPGICALYDFGRTRDSYFLAMEYLVGETFERVGAVLQQRSRATTMMRTPYFIARLVADVAEALHSVHEARDEEGRPLEIVHRDVTPHNLFVLYDGSIRVTDFGIARSRDRVHQTQSGVLKGKIGYMAPEQLGQEPVDRRCDVWSVGVVLWEMLANERLFSAPNVAATVDAVQNRPVRAPSQLNPFVPAALDAIALRALDRDKAKRYQTMRELALDLELFLSTRKDTVPAADVTEWLDGLFPGEGARRRDLVARTRGMVPTSMPPAPISLAGDEARTDELTLPRLNRPAAHKRMVSRPLWGAAGSLLVLAMGAWAVYAALTGVDSRLTQHSKTPVAAGASAVEERFEPATLSAVRAAPGSSVSAHQPALVPAPTEQRARGPAVPAAPGFVSSAPSGAAAAEPAARSLKRTPPRAPAASARPAPARTAPTEPVAVAARGQVFVSATAPAEVFYLGKRVGRAPLGISLPVGTQLLELKPSSGGPAVSVTVDVKQGAIGMTRVTLP